MSEMPGHRDPSELTDVTVEELTEVDPAILAKKHSATELFGMAAHETTVLESEQAEIACLEQTLAAKKQRVLGLQSRISSLMTAHTIVMSEYSGE